MSSFPFRTVYVGETRIVLSVDGGSGVWFPLSALMHCMGRVLLQLVMVSLQLSELLLIMLLNLWNAGLELLESISICHGRWGKIGAFERGLAFEAKPRANHGWKERPQGTFYCGPTVGAKCTYQNPKLADAKVDVVEMGFTISHVGLWVPFVRRTRRGAYKTKDSDAQVSMWVRWEWKMKRVR